MICFRQAKAEEFSAISLVGGTLGGLVGSQVAGRLVGEIGVANLLLIPAVLLFAATVCLWPRAGQRFTFSNLKS